MDGGKVDGFEIENNGEKVQESYTYSSKMLVKKKYRGSLMRHMDKKRKKRRGGRVTKNQTALTTKFQV